MKVYTEDLVKQKEEALKKTEEIKLEMDLENEKQKDQQLINENFFKEMENLKNSLLVNNKC